MIRGNTVGVSMPRADYGQTDANMADFILNKPEETIRQIQATADGALPKGGGTMTGAIDMAGKPLRNLPAPTADADPATKKYVDEKLAGKVKFFSAAVPAQWTGDGAPWSITVSVPGLLESDRPDVDLVPSSDFGAAEKQLEGWGLVYRGVTAADTLTLYAQEKVEVELPIQLKVVR